MARGSFGRRHRVGIASGVALAIASAALGVYAVTASGYKSHEADLNDGGVWVVNGKKGWSGRLNKPINQLDGVVPGEDGKTRLDVVQDGASVVTLDLNSARGQAIETSRLQLQDGGTAAVPASASVRMGGGSLASTDSETGEVWAVRYDAEVGTTLMSSLDMQTKAIAEAGEDAALAVSQAGTIVVTSAADGTVTTIAPEGPGFAEPSTTDLPGDAGQVSDVAMVGERTVTLDADSGVLRVLDGATASVPAGSVLQQSGPAYDAVLVGAGDSLLSVDLESGEVTTITSSYSGTPVRPVRLGACVFGAWSGGLGAVARQCGSQEVMQDDLGGNATSLAFRVNRGEIVLNDATSGNVWDVQQDAPIDIDNWDAFTSKKQSEDDEKENENPTDADRRPPTAKPDSYGVRPGRTTVLHPLDNDAAPEGRLLSIVDVDQPTGGARVEISPDGQTLVLQMPDRARPATFDYVIDDGRNGLSARASIAVDVRAGSDNEAPELRQGYRRPVYRVPHAGALAVPVLADWRDDTDGDTLLLDSANAVGGEQSGAVARTTADGRIRFSAPTSAADGPQTVRVELAVTDGRSTPVKSSLVFQVQAPKDQNSFPPSAEPDVVRGEVGTPIKIRPLLNDLPGSDPDTPNAELSLGGKVPQQPGAKVVTDLDSGQLTFTADRTGTYFLSYDAGYGNAELDEGTIRVDVKPRPKRAAEPIAMPDTLTVYGQAPGIVDVLANDLDPAGGLLVVQRASGDRDGQLDVAIVDGRWLRIAAVQPDLAPTTQTVSYTISNGTSSGIRGEVVVTQRPAPTDNTPITAGDRVVVRAGTSVSAPVLDNDVSPSGDRLTLVSDVVDSETPGELDVVAPIDVTGDVGRAFVSGRLVRYVAPDDIAERDTYEITYVAQNLDGEKGNGVLKVTVVPRDDPNDPPEPPTLESRVTSADTVKIRVPGTGVDRNGDPVTVTGITSAPRLGRIVGYGGNFLEYEAYPRTVGTDEFTYSVVDSQGAFATGTVRVAVVSAVQPQPPLAVADRLTVAPGRTATFDPLANDFIAPGDSVEVALLDAPADAKLDPDTNLVRVRAPKSDSPPLVLVYSVTNGLSESRATMTLETEEGFNNPPIVYDAFGRADDSGSVAVDVLEGAYDPDGPVDDLRVTDVSGDRSATVVDGVSVRADRGAAPKVLPFVVEDGDGGSATASVYVPPTGTGLPYVVDGALITLDPGESTTGKLSDYVSAPDGADVRLASGRTSWAASPEVLSVRPEGSRGFALSAPDTFRGPGALLVEVTTATDGSGNEDASTTDDGATVLLSIPVLVGDDRPELECPSSVVPISAGQRFDLDIASFCKVFTVDPRDEVGLDYSAAWSDSVDGLDVGSPEGSVVAVTAAETATQGGEAVLAVRAGESNTEEVRFRLAQAPPPTMNPIKVDAMEAGETRTIDVTPYLQAGVADPEPTIVQAQSLGSSGVRVSTDGSRLTLVAAKDARGTKAEIRLVVSDVSSSSPPEERRADARIQFQVIGVPSAPGEPRPYNSSDEVGTVKMSWRPPADDGGAPILYYMVREERSGDTQRCETNECVYRNLKDGGNYNFRVRAYNRVGPSDYSDLSTRAVVDTEPGRVENIRMTVQGDHQITIAWDKPRVSGTRIIDYTISWAGGQTVVPGEQLSATALGLDNNVKYAFTIKAQNKAGFSSPRTSPEFQPLGTPPAPPAPAVTDLETGANQTSMRITWQAVLPEGQGPTVYTVSYSNGVTSGAVPGCQKLASLTCTHSAVPYDGLTYTYTVVAANQPANQPGKRSPASPGTSIEAVGRPAAWDAWSVVPTGADQQLRVTGRAPDPRGAQGTVAVLVDGRVAREVGVVAGQGISEVVNTASNENPATVQLRICNEKAPAGCTLSPPQTTQSYGPFNNIHLNPITGSANGKHIVFQVSGTSNGDQGVLSYSFDGGPQQQIRPSGNGGFSLTIETDAADYNRDVRLTVSLSDDAPAGRGSTSEQATVQAGDPPPPTVTIFKGASCRDNDGNPDTPDCSNLGAFGCTNDRCGFLYISVDGARATFGCQVTRSSANQNVNRYQPNMGNGTTQTDWVFDAGYIEVTCSTGPGTQNGDRFSVTAGYTWPG